MLIPAHSNATWEGKGNIYFLDYVKNWGLFRVKCKEKSDGI